MGGVQRRKSGAKNKKLHRGLKTKNYIRDHDQIHEDIKNPEKYEKMQINEEQPGSGQYYCISCARFFESLATLQVHKGTKKHKRMLSRMQQKPYSHKQAYEAGK